jgi:Na+-driven multidrug efflux pump
VIDSGVVVMVVVGLTLPLWGLQLVTTGPLRGSGDTRSPMYRSTVATWTSVLLAWIGVTYFDAGMGWIWGTYLVTLPPAIWGNWRAFRRRVEQPAEEPAVTPSLALAAD